MNVEKFDAKARKLVGLLRLSRVAHQRGIARAEGTMARIPVARCFDASTPPEYTEALNIRDRHAHWVEVLTRQIRGLEMYLHADDPGHHVHREEPCA